MSNSLDSIQRDPLVAKYRKACVSRNGPSAIKSIGRRFRNYDNDRSGFLSKSEFMEGVQDTCKEDLTKAELDELYDLFDRNDDGQVNYEEFLACVRPPMSEGRITLIQKVFHWWDAKNAKKGEQDGIITVEDIKTDYDVRHHPKFQSGEMTKTQILTQFLNSFEPDLDQRDGKITLQEFQDYYAGVSVSVDQDLYFDYMMRQAWPKAFQK